jgi:hypothetical protein
MLTGSRETLMRPVGLGHAQCLRHPLYSLLFRNHVVLNEIAMDIIQIYGIAPGGAFSLFATFYWISTSSTVMTKMSNNEFSFSILFLRHSFFDSPEGHWMSITQWLLYLSTPIMSSRKSQVRRKG